MTRIVFCRTRHHYDSYVDFFRLVTASGFPTIFIDEIDLQAIDTTYIFTPWNGEVELVLHRRSDLQEEARVVHWLLERDLIDKEKSGQPGVVAKHLDREFALVDAVWVSDRSFATLDYRLQHVILGGHSGIATLMPASDGVAYDVCPLAYLWGRRANMIDALQRAGISIAPSAYGKEQQDFVLAHSRIVLSLHQYADAKVIAPLRFAVAASYGLPLISEEVDDCYPLRADYDVELWPFNDIVNAMETLLRFPESMHHLAANLFQTLCVEHRFDLEVRAAVAKMDALS